MKTAQPLHRFQLQTGIGDQEESQKVIMSYRTVYVFYPDTIFEDNGTELKCAEQYLEKFFIEHRQSLAWCNCTDKWKRWYREDHAGKTNAELTGLLSFRDYLLDEGFAERNSMSFRESDEFSHHLDNHVNDDFAGFFICDTEYDDVASVWQCLNPKGFIDRIKAIEDWKSGPLVTKTGKYVRSCLVSQLAPTTPAPDAFVDCGEWHIRNAVDPVTGQELTFRPHDLHESWEGYFWFQADRCSPNTRVTAVECHY
jgi:hypothetical protein